MSPPNRTHMASHYHGPYPANLWTVLEVCHRLGSVSIQSNLARGAAIELALAASIGWITTVSPDGASHGARWRLTQAGLLAHHHREYLE